MIGNMRPSITKMRTINFFDMGHGLAFTVSPLSVPHPAFVPPENGLQLLEKELQMPWEFLKPFLHFKISAHPSEEENGFNVRIPHNVPPTEWQVLQSDAFPIQRKYAVSRDSRAQENRHPRC